MSSCSVGAPKSHLYNDQAETPASLIWIEKVLSTFRYRSPAQYEEVMALQGLSQEQVLDKVFCDLSSGFQAGQTHGTRSGFGYLTAQAELRPR